MNNVITKSVSNLNKTLASYGDRWDIVVGIMLMVGVGIMLVPLPTWLMDVFLAINLSFTMIILMVAFYLKNPLDLSSFPAIILLATIFRLSLSISTTRLILLHGDAGHIVSGFGNFVVAGSVAVGIIIFILITIVQFVVVTKGAERIAEVAARFTLDALPGKQIAIDADVRAGDLTKEEARIRRSELSRESQFFGAMDGAMKFVKGDAIAGIIIVIVNLIGGIAIGVVSKGMDFSQAVNVYSLLSIGDGLVAQIPSLLLAMAAGSVVTRVSNDDNTNLGADIAKQITGDASALYMASGALFLFGIIPGFPKIIFWGLAALIGFAGFVISKKKNALKDEIETDTTETTQETLNEEDDEDDNTITKAENEVKRDDVMGIYISSQLYEKIHWRKFNKALTHTIEIASTELGIAIPAIGVSQKAEVPQAAWEIHIDGARIFRGFANDEYVAINLDDEALSINNIQPIDSVKLPNGEIWNMVKIEDADKIKDSNVQILDKELFMNRAVYVVMVKWAASFVGLQEAGRLLNESEERFPELIREVRSQVPMQKLSDVLRRLLDEGVNLVNLRIILEAIIRHHNMATDAETLTDLVRVSLARQISQKYADGAGVIKSLVLRDDFEMMLKMARGQGTTRPSSINPQQSRSLEMAIKKSLGSVENGAHPVILASAEIRRLLKNLIKSFDLDIPVLSYQEISGEHRIGVVGTVGLQ